MARRRIRPEPAQLVEEYREDPELGIAGLIARHRLPYGYVRRVLDEAGVLQGPLRRR